MRVGSFSFAIMAVVGLLLTQPAAAADRRFPSAAGTLVLDVDANWNDADDMPAELRDEVFGFRVGDGSTMRWLISPGNDAPPGAGSQGSLRELTNDMKRELERQNAEVGEMQTLSGSSVSGFYFKARDPKPKPGEWQFMYTGWVAVGSFPVMFNIVWNQGGQSAADRALASVRSLRLTR